MRHVKTRTLSLLALLLCLTLSSAMAQMTDWPAPEDLTYDPIDFAPPTPTKTTLSNGVTVFLAEDHTLPLISGVAYINAPSVFDPADKVGLATMTATLLREGGAGGRSTEELDEQLEFLAASVEASANAAFASVSFSSLAEDVADVMDIWKDVIVYPEFDAERFELARGRQLESIRRENDNPVTIAVREFFYRLANEHPSGYFATADTVNAISRDDLIDFHARYFKPSAVSVAISGDFDTPTMIALLEATLGSWEDAPVTYPELPAFDMTPEPRVYFAQKETSQSIILVGHPSVLAYSPEYNDLDVANQILGSGFTSRLFTEIRTRRGLAYSTGSALSQGFEYPGNFYAYAITNAEDTGQVIELLKNEVKKLQTEGVTQAELEQQRETILNRSLFRFTSAADIAARSARTHLLGLPEDYYETYLENVQTISPEDIQRIVTQELRPDDFVVMVVGDASKFDQPLSNFGTVEEIELE